MRILKRHRNKAIVAFAIILLQNGTTDAFALTPAYLAQESRVTTRTLSMAGKGFGNNSSSGKSKKNGKNDRKAGASESSKSPVTIDQVSSEPAEYPAMNRAEISKWMNHIPVYAVTDPDGNAKAIKLGDRAVVYFFMSSIVAEAYKKKLKESGEDFANSTVSGLFLGNIWFDFLDQDSQSDDAEFRLVPDPRDVTSARTILSMETPEEELVDEIASDEGDTDDEIFEQLMDAIESPFSSAYNDIPLFYVDNMPLAEKSEDIKKFLNQMVSSSYMFFSTHNMFQILDKFKESGEALDNSNDALCSLFDVVSMMQKPHTIDFRNVVLIPPAPVTEGTVSDAVIAKELDDPTSILSQSFFLPLFQAES